MHPLCALLVALPLLAASALPRPTPTPPPDLQEAAPRPREFWTAIVAAGGGVPAGEDAVALLLELSAHLGARDPELRDGCGYGLAERWILRERRVDAAGARRLLARWQANLAVGLGEEGPSDATLLRSFSGLDLSLLAALDLEAPFLSEDELDALLSDAVAWLEGERDLRGWEPELGWVHACAHAADLLRFLARNPKLDAGGQALILFAVAGRMSAPVAAPFVHGEDDRLARAVVSLLARDDFDPELFSAALEPLAAALAAAAAAEPFDPERFAAATNARNLLRALFVRLAAAGELTPRQAAAREAVLAVLAGS